jgi:non-canonical (house-cleaning) NTP pyrophosphatase
MIKIILCSKSDIKINALRKWLHNKYNNIKFEITTLSIDNPSRISPDQPINIGGLTCCHDRIKQTEINYSSEVKKNKYIVSIENSINVKDDKLSDVVNVVIKNLETNAVYVKTGSEITINYNILDKYPKFLKILDEFTTSYKTTSTNYVFNGCQETLGSLINKYYTNVPKDNWMKTLFNIDRIDQIYKLLSSIENIIYDDSGTTEQDDDYDTITDSDSDSSEIDSDLDLEETGVDVEQTISLET